MKNPLIGLGVFCLVSCQVEDSLNVAEATEGYHVSTYLSESEVQQVGLQVAERIENPAKTISTNSYILVGEDLKGIHLLPNKDNATPAAFLKIPLMKDFTLLENVLLENNPQSGKIYGDLLIASNGKSWTSFDLRNASNIAQIGYTQASALGLGVTVRNRKSNVFEFINTPPASKVFYECPDTTRYAAEWQKMPIDVQKAKCFN